MRKIINKFCIGLILVGIFAFDGNIYAAVKVETQNGKNTTEVTANTINNGTVSNLIKNATTNTTINSKNMAKSQTPQVDATKKVYDFANLLTETEEQNIYTSIKEFIDTYNMDMAVVTINENNKSSSMAYADDFYDYNDFGIGSKNSGLLFLIDMDNRIMWISTTGDAIKMYNDNRIDSILDYTYDKISDKDYYGCASEFVKYAKYFAEKGVDGTNTIRSVPEKIFLVLIIPIIATIIVVIYGVFQHRNVRKQQTAKTYITKDSIKLSNSQDQFISTHTTKTKIETSSGGGGSSTHTGSSGISHGGGGRSF